MTTSTSVSFRGLKKELLQPVIGTFQNLMRTNPSPFLSGFWHFNFKINSHTVSAQVDWRPELSPSLMIFSSYLLLSAISKSCVVQ